MTRAVWVGQERVWVGHGLPGLIATCRTTSAIPQSSAAAVMLSDYEKTSNIFDHYIYNRQYGSDLPGRN